MQVIMEGSLRATLAFVVILVVVRLLGKRTGTSLTFFDFVTGTVIGGMGALLAAGLNINEWGILTALLTFIVWMILSGHFSLESRPLRKLLKGEPVVIVSNGKILEGNMALLGYSPDDLMALLREEGYCDITEVEYGILETNGRVSVLSRSQDRPVNPGDMGIPVSSKGTGELEDASDHQI